MSLAALEPSPMWVTAAVVSVLALLLLILACGGWLLVRRRMRKRRSEKEQFLHRRSLRLKLPPHQASAATTPNKPPPVCTRVGVPVQVQPYSYGDTQSKQIQDLSISANSDRRSSLPTSLRVVKAFAVPYDPYNISSSEYMSTDAEDDRDMGSLGSRSSDSSPDHKSKPKRRTPALRKNAKEAPSLHFSVIYTSTNACLTVNVEKITNIPIEYRKNTSIFFRVSLQSLIPEVQAQPRQSQLTKDSLNPQFKENFVFPNLAAEDACRAILEVHLFVRKYGKLRDKLVGIVQIGLEDVELLPDQPLQCSEKFTLVRRQKTSTSGADSRRLEDAITKPINMFVSLEFKAFANRLKVMVRKASNLPDSRGLVPPHYYVIVNLCHRDEEVTYKETRSISGRNPVWNTPFIFNINAEQVEDHWLQLIVMRGRIYNHDGAVGHVLIGKDTTPAGAEHWAETIKPYSKECAKWHPVVPM